MQHHKNACKCFSNAFGYFRNQDFIDFVSLMQVDGTQYLILNFLTFYVFRDILKNHKQATPNSDSTEVIFINHDVWFSCV